MYVSCVCCLAGAAVSPGADVELGPLQLPALRRVAELNRQPTPLWTQNYLY